MLDHNNFGKCQRSAGWQNRFGKELRERIQLFTVCKRNWLTVWEHQHPINRIDQQPSIFRRPNGLTVEHGQRFQWNWSSS